MYIIFTGLILRILNSFWNVYVKPSVGANLDAISFHSAAVEYKNTLMMYGFSGEEYADKFRDEEGLFTKITEGMRTAAERDTYKPFFDIQSQARQGSFLSKTFPLSTWQIRTRN